MGSAFTLIGSGEPADLDKSTFDLAIQSFGNARSPVLKWRSSTRLVKASRFEASTMWSPSALIPPDLQMADVALALRQMEGSGTRLNDACRNNPFSSRGLRTTVAILPK